MTDTFALPDPSAAALRYHAELALNWALFSALGLLFPLGVLYGGLAARLRDGADRIARRPWIAAMLFYVMYELLAMAFFTPFSWWRGLEIAREFGRTNRSTADWLADRLINGAADAALLAPLIAIGFMLVRRFPRWWWALFTAVYLPYAAFMTVAYPVLVTPLTVKESSLPQGALRARIEQLAAASGIEPRSIVVENTSAKSNAINAYVSGYGPWVRIAFTDNALAKYSEDELVFVMAHELGHHRLGHAWQGLLRETLLTGVSLFVIAWLGPVLIARNARWWKIQSVSDIAVLPLVFVLMAISSMATAPAVNAFHRRQEAAADAYALQATGGRDVCASRAKKALVGNLAVPEPDPLLHAITGTHPSAAARMAACKGGDDAGSSSQ